MSEGLVVVAVGSPVAKHLANGAVRAFLFPTAVVRGVGGFLRRLGLCGTIFGVVEVETIANVAEETRFPLDLVVFLAVETETV